jgi:membrane protease YdiL (CAAX protease family)
VAATAGITEEFLYRGYVLWLGTALLGGRAWAGAALSALAFGLLHAYQRPVGVLRATCMGLWLAWPVIAGGPLAAAMIAHATADLVIGLVVGPRWARERALSR